MKSLKDLDQKKLQKRHSWVLFGLGMSSILFVRAAIDLIKELVRDELEHLWFKVLGLSFIIVVIILIVYLIRIDREIARRKETKD